MALKIIKIPRAPKSSFNKERDVSTLLQSQVAHVVREEQQLPQDKQTGVSTESIATEHEAAEYVGKVMRHLHPKARKAWRLPPGKRAPHSGVWLGPARLSVNKRSKKAAKKKAAKRTRTASKRTREAGKKR